MSSEHGPFELPEVCKINGTMLTLVVREGGAPRRLVAGLIDGLWYAAGPPDWSLTGVSWEILQGHLDNPDAGMELVSVSMASVRSLVWIEGTWIGEDFG